MTSKVYSLESDGTFYIDQEGTSWESPAAWLWIDILGGCGCGSQQDIQKLVIEVLDYFASPNYQKDAHNIYGNLSKEIIAHWMDH